MEEGAGDTSEWAPRDPFVAEGPRRGNEGPTEDPQLTPPLEFTEAEEKKHKRKLKEFRQYLVDTRVIQVLVERTSARYTPSKLTSPYPVGP